MKTSTRTLTIVLGTLTAFGPLSIDMYLPGLPAIGRELGAAPSSVQLTLSLFFMGMAGGQIVYGPLSDRYGRRLPLLIGCLLYTIASVGCALANSIEALIGLRLLQALGGCAGMVIARSVVRDLFEARDSARMFSFLMLVMGLAPITAPFLGGQLLNYVGWRAIFWLLTGFGLACVALVLTQLPETMPPERRVRSGLAQIFRTYGTLLADRYFVGYALAGGLISAAMFAYISGSPFVIIEHYGVAPDRYGFIFGANALGLISASQINRRLLQSWTSEQILKWALPGIMLASLALLGIALTNLGGLVGLLVPLFVCVAGGGLVQPNTSALALAPHARTAGSASAMLGALQFTAGTIAGTLVGLLHNGTAWPMAAVIATCCCAALAMRWLTLPHSQASVVTG